MVEPFRGSQRDSDSPLIPQLYSPQLTNQGTRSPFRNARTTPTSAFPRGRGRPSVLAAARVVLSVLRFCLDRQVADVFERLLSRKPAPDRKRVDREAQQGDGEDVPADVSSLRGPWRPSRGIELGVRRSNELRYEIVPMPSRYGQSQTALRQSSDSVR
jgi:hypothetical protein